MHIFIPVYLNDQLSELQSHVQAQVLALSKAGHHCTVMCQPGIFAEVIQKRNVSVLLTDFNDINEAVKLAKQTKTQYSLVHAHPFQSRIVGLEIARHFEIPFLITFHGMYADALSSYSQEVDILIAVNGAIKEYLVKTIDFPSERIQVVPDGVMTDIFRPLEGTTTISQEIFEHPECSHVSVHEADRVISCVFRFDDDKRFILDVIQEAWTLQASTGKPNILWLVAGDGPLRDELGETASAVNQQAGRQFITLLGKLNDEELRLLYNCSHLSVASGHNVLDSMACGTPTISVSSQGYFGLVNSENSLAGVATNFKGTGQKQDKCSAESLFGEVERVVYDERKLSHLRKLSYEIIYVFYRQERQDKQLLHLYRLLQASEARNKTVRYDWVMETRAWLSFISPKEEGEISSHWSYPVDDEKINASAQQNGSIEINYSGDPDDKFYLKTALGGFHVPPPDHEDWYLEEGHNYKLNIPLTTSKEGLVVTVWVIEYDGRQRLSETIQNLHNGQNDIHFTPSAGSTRFRVAIRCSGNGTVLIAPISFFKERTIVKKEYKNMLLSKSNNEPDKAKQNRAVKTSNKQKTTKYPNKNNRFNIEEQTRKAINSTVVQDLPISVDLQRISLCYRRTAGFFLTRNKRMRASRKYWALRDLSLSIYEGDTVGLIGRNGSGKSTTSMVISGALKPDKGEVKTYGKVQLLALGIGFRPQLTGRENVMISGTILGMPRKEVKARMDEIEEFAELGEFFDEPIRTYSTGMKSRLGFAVSTAVQPDILILDEVMSTGDAAFRNKANKRMKKMRDRTKTVIVVSHSPAQIKELCSRVVWLEKGRLLMDGSIEDVLPKYEEFCEKPKKWLDEYRSQK